MVLRGDLGLPPLPEYWAEGLKVVFCGFNPGETAARIGHYYGYPGNRFWTLLHQAGFTPRLYRPEEDAGLLELGLGLTDIVRRPSKSSSDLSGWEFRAGRADFVDKLRRYRPRAVCYNGKGVYAALAGRPGSAIAYGLQPASVVEGVLDFVACSPSGRSREPLSRKLEVYRELYRLVMAQPAPAGLSDCSHPYV